MTKQEVKGPKPGDTRFHRCIVCQEDTNQTCDKYGWWICDVGMYYLGSKGGHNRLPTAGMPGWEDQVDPPFSGMTQKDH